MKAYYGSRISEHMIRTPEGFLICRDVPIARTGTQEYMGEEFGAPSPETVYTVTRPEEEVFTDAAIASFEGKPVVNEHPEEDVTADNYQKYLKGVCRDVRRGEGAYRNYLIANLIIYDEDLIQQIEGGKRDISCGYECLWEPNGDEGYTQRDIRGNHIAVVTRGRAGRKVSIRDTDKEGTRMRKSSLWGRMLSAFAHDSDTTPEDLEQAARLAPAGDEEEEPKKEEKSPAAFDSAEMMERMDRIEGALQALLAKKEEAKEEEEVEEETKKEERTALDELEEELKGKEEEAGDEEAVNIPPETAKEEDEDGEEEGRKAALEAIDAVKPVLAKLEDPAQRQKAADALAGLIRGRMPDSGYGVIMGAKRSCRTMDKAMDDRALGKFIRDTYNPHYRKN